MEEYKPGSTDEFLADHDQNPKAGVLLEVSSSPNYDSKERPLITLRTTYIGREGREETWEREINETSFLHIGKIAEPPEPLPAVDETKLVGEDRVTWRQRKNIHEFATKNALQNATFYAYGCLSESLRDIDDPDVAGQIIDQLVAAAQAANEQLRASNQ